MAGFAVLIAYVSIWYLIPAMRAAQVASGEERRQLAAHSRLLLCVVLFILFAGLLLTFRFGRYFAPRVGEKTKPTDYPDAWTESARRVSVPPRGHEEDES